MIGFLGKDVGYEISTCQMQYNAANKKTDQEDPCYLSIYLSIRLNPEGDIRRVPVNQVLGVSSFFFFLCNVSCVSS